MYTYCKHCYNKVTIIHLRSRLLANRIKPFREESLGEKNLNVAAIGFLSVFVMGFVLGSFFSFLGIFE